MPYAKLLGPMGLNIPFVILTDADWRVASDGARVSAGLRRAVRLSVVLSDYGSGVLETMFDNRQWSDLYKAANRLGIFVGNRTLEVDLFDEGHGPEIVEAMEELGISSATMQELADILERGTPLSDVDSDRLLRLVERIGKGRVSQRMAGKIVETKAPTYIKDGVSKIVEVLSK